MKDRSTYLGAQRLRGGVGGVAHQQPGTRPPSTSGKHVFGVVMSDERRVRGGAPEATPLGCSAGMGTAPAQPTARVQHETHHGCLAAPWSEPTIPPGCR